MSKHWEQTVKELQSAGILDDETVTRIEVYYHNKQDSLSYRQLLVFGILGAVLVGLGVILIIAHNWDNLSRTLKAVLAFVPLIAGQLICLYTLYYRKSIVWRESSSVFLFFAVGSTMTLISQIYNLPGDLGDFVLTWIILCLPQIYLLRSSCTSLLYLVGITFYACEVGYWSFNSEIPWLYWPLMAAIIPNYAILVKKSSRQNAFAVMHHWVMPLSVIISLGTISNRAEELFFVAYIALFSLLFLGGRYIFKTSRTDFFNSYQLMGSAGILILLLIFSFSGNWRFIHHFNPTIDELARTNVFWISILLLLATTAVTIHQLFIKKDWQEYNLTGYAVYIFILSFILAMLDPFYAVIFINLFLFLEAVLIVRQGLVTNHLGILNYGLLIAGTLIACRFFDMKISFIIRGIIFLVVGTLFFILNYRIIKRRKV